MKTLPVSRTIFLPWTKEETLGLPLPGSWEVTDRLTVDAPPRLTDLAASIRAALNEPADSPPLTDLVGPETSITLVMDDTGRTTPVSKMAPVVLDYLLEAGD